MHYRVRVLQAQMVLVDQVGGHQRDVGRLSTAIIVWVPGESEDPVLRSGQRVGQMGAHQTRDSCDNDVLHFWTASSLLMWRVKSGVLSHAGSSARKSRLGQFNSMTESRRIMRRTQYRATLSGVTDAIRASAPCRSIRWMESRLVRIGPG